MAAPYRIDGNQPGPRRFTSEQIHKGFGILKDDAGQDFPRQKRDYLARQLVKAYNNGQLRTGTDLHKTAIAVHHALSGGHSMLMDLRLHLFLNEDGSEDKQMAERVRWLVSVVPDMDELVRWLQF